jgi:hypothetical protein
LEELSLSSSSSAEEGGEKEKEVSSKKKKNSVTVEDLKRNGYRGGPSVLLVREAAPEEDWAWSNGRNHAKACKESASEREVNREAANEATAFAVKKQMEHSKNLSELKRKEWKDKRKGGIGYGKDHKNTVKRTKVVDEREKE